MPYRRECFKTDVFTDVRLYVPWIKTTIRTKGDACRKTLSADSGSQPTSPHSLFISVITILFCYSLQISLFYMIDSVDE